MPASFWKEALNYDDQTPVLHASSCFLVATFAVFGAPAPKSHRMSTPEIQSPTRRSVLGKIWAGLGGLALLEGVWIVTDFLKPRKRQGTDETAETLIVAGPVDNFDPGSVTAFQQGKFYLARLDDGGFLALHRECTHLGCTVPWISAENRFVCPCHASVFDIQGEVLSPPAPRPLDLFAVRIENGIVKVDTSKPLERRSFSASQVVQS